MKMKTICAATVLALAGMSNANALDLSTTGFVSYGDGQSFSLPVAQFICGQLGGTNTECSSQFSVKSTPGAIQDLIVIATGAEGKQVTTNTAGMDDAFSTPSGVSGSTSFLTSPGTSRGEDGTIFNNLTSTWDASLAALQTFFSDGMGGFNAPVFFFNNNQINSGASTNQSLAIWARLSVTDDTGAPVLLGGQTALTFANRTPIIAANDCLGGAGAPSVFGGVNTPGTGGCPSVVENDNVFEYGHTADPVVGTNAATDFVQAGGAVCLSNLPPFSIVPCGTPNSTAINHNLGADEVAYAVLFPELNAVLNALFLSATDLTDYTFHLDLRMGCDLPDVGGVRPATCIGRDLNNGYEQLFLGSITQTIPVPEPGTLALLGGFLAMLPALRRIRRRMS